MERARPLAVPLTTDSVAPCRLTYGNLSVAGAEESRRDLADTALFFEIRDWEEHLEVGQGGGLGRVTFEGLDAVRASRGEVAPYDDGNDFSSWVYVVENSSWLRERHDYEWLNYQTPLLSSHQHYVFRFHDEYVEALAEGIWLDQPRQEEPFLVDGTHPLAPLPDAYGRAANGESYGLPWDLWITERAEEDLLRDSQLCSQRLFEYALHLDGGRLGVTSCWLRTKGAVTRSTLARSWTKNMPVFDGIARAEDALPAWEYYCAEVAERRRAMGK